MKLYVVTITKAVPVEGGGSSFSTILMGVFDDIGKAKWSIRYMFKKTFYAKDPKKYIWDETLLDDNGYGPFDAGFGCEVQYDISERWLNEVRDRQEEHSTYVASYVSYDIHNRKVLEEEHVIIDGPSDFKAYSLDKESRMKNPSKAVWNVFNEFRYLDEDAKVLYYTYLEVFQKSKGGY